MVKKGEIIGRGYHHRAGKPHAEPLALRDAGEAAKGATLVVTLEPCSTHGKTPPCTEAILQADIRKVIIGCTDPNPAHAGRGLDILRNAGIEVEAGVLEDECRDLIRAFAHRQLTGLPYVTLKLACTLDGRIADAKGRSKLQWKTILKQLVQRGIQHILCEGGGQLASALLKADLVQELHWVLAPTLLGQDARPAIGPGWSLDNAPSFRIIDRQEFGNDLWLHLRVAEGG